MIAIRIVPPGRKAGIMAEEEAGMKGLPKPGSSPPVMRHMTGKARDQGGYSRPSREQASFHEDSQDRQGQGYQGRGGWESQGPRESRKQPSGDGRGAQGYSGGSDWDAPQRGQTFQVDPFPKGAASQTRASLQQRRSCTKRRASWWFRARRRLRQEQGSTTGWPRTVWRQGRQRPQERRPRGGKLGVTGPRRRFWLGQSSCCQGKIIRISAVRARGRGMGSLPAERTASSNQI